MTAPTMPADAAEIVRLAELCEAATGPDRELDGAIDRLFNARPKDGDYDEGEGAFWRVQNGWSGLLVRTDGSARDSFSAANYTASLDDSMTLLDPVWGYEQRMTSGDPSDCWVEIWWVPEFPGRAYGKGTTPALAFTAAALKARARAAQHDHEVG